MSESRWVAVGSLATVAAAAIALLAWLWPSGSSSSPSSPQAAVSSPGIGAALSPGASASGPVSGGYVGEYKDIEFRMPGMGCVYEGARPNFIPSDVLFTAQGPQVQVQANGTGTTDLGSFALECNDSGADGVPYFSTGGQIATVGGTSDPAACRSALTLRPLSGGLRVADLHAGSAVCVQITDGAQLALLRLVGIDPSTYDTTWSATGWLEPAAG